MRGERQRHHLGELVDAALGHRVGNLVGDGEDGVDRRQVDDRPRLLATPDALDHVARHCLTAEERALQVGAQNPVEVRFLEIQEIFRGEDGGVVDEHVDPPEGRDRRLDQPGDRARVADVAAHITHRSEPAEVFRRGGAGRVIHVGDDHPRAFLQEAVGDGLADAPRAPGDDSNLVFENHGLIVPLLNPHRIMSASQSTCCALSAP